MSFQKKKRIYTMIHNAKVFVHESAHQLLEVLHWGHCFTLYSWINLLVLAATIQNTLKELL